MEMQSLCGWCCPHLATGYLSQTPEFSVHHELFAQTLGSSAASTLPLTAPVTVGLPLMTRPDLQGPTHPSFSEAQFIPLSGCLGHGPFSFLYSCGKNKGNMEFIVLAVFKCAVQRHTQSPSHYCTGLTTICLPHRGYIHCTLTTVPCSPWQPPFPFACDSDYARKLLYVESRVSPFG